MRSVAFFLFSSILSILTCFSQQSITLTFTAIDSASYIQLDSIKVMNHTQGGDTTLFWYDTLLVLNVPVGIPDIHSRKEGYEMRSFPNPVTDDATIELVLPVSGETVLTVSDVLGRSLCIQERDLQAGSHTFQFVPGNETLYFTTASCNGYRMSIKVINSSQNNDQQCRILYQGHGDEAAQEKAAEAMQDFTFEMGDELLFIGYVDSLESGQVDSPDSSTIYTFQFAYNIPCPGTPTVTYDGQVYNTVQIFSQCWLKENLNVGEMINAPAFPSQNGFIEKYCYDNDSFNCIEYGGIYHWAELMNYNYNAGTQGICPEGWHIPTDEEFKILYGCVDSMYPIGDPEWDKYYTEMGYDAGYHLRSTYGWWSNNNGSDKFGFTGKGAGFLLWEYIGMYGFYNLDSSLILETSKNGFGEPIQHEIRGAYSTVLRTDTWPRSGSVRCVKD